MISVSCKLVASTILIFLASCNYAGDSCEGVDTTESGPFDISNIAININNYSNGMSITQPVGLEIADKNIEIVINTEQVWLSSNANLWDFFIASAKACSLIPPRGASNITQFKVVIVGPLNEEVDVSNYFNVVEESEFYIQGLPLKVSEYIFLDPLVSRSYILRTNEEVIIEGEYSIGVSLVTSSGYELFSSEGPFNIVNNS